AGVYLSYAIRLKSNITLHLDQGARVLGAPNGIDGRGYDAAEPNPEGGNYQDGGHTHWHDGLIWGVGLENIAIVGQGIIDGTNIGTGDNGGGGGGRGANRGRGGPATGPAQADAAGAGGAFGPGNGPVR